jgi:hypothetical protein
LLGFSRFLRLGRLCREREEQDSYQQGSHLRRFLSTWLPWIF